MTSYKDAGVDISAGEEFVDLIRPLAAKTGCPGVMGNLGGFGAIFDLKVLNMRDPLLVTTTDGVGTKLEISREVPGGLHLLGQDLVAMCVNDIVCLGATPLTFLDYLSTGKLDSETYIPLIQGIADACEQAGCALVGGETAEMPGIYQPKDFDIAGFCVGAVERTEVLPQHVAPGSTIIGIASSGIHSNGFSLVRKILQDQNISLTDPTPWDPALTIGEVLTKPTRLYVNTILALHKLGYLHAVAHITGGGLVGNLPRVIPAGLSAHITNPLPAPPIFHWLQTQGHIPGEEMMKVFNMGTGMCVITADPNSVINILNQMGEDAQVIGEVTTGMEPIVFE